MGNHGRRLRDSGEKSRTKFGWVRRKEGETGIPASEIIAPIDDLKQCHVSWSQFGYEAPVRFRLGCVRKPTLKPIADGSQRNKSHEPAGEFFVPGGNRAVLLESLEEILHMVWERRYSEPARSNPHGAGKTTL